MATAFLGNDEVGYSFRFDPNSVSWGYQERSTSYDTLGGRVIQLLGVDVTSLTVTGDAGTRRELQKMGSQVHRIMQWQVRHERPVDFRVPIKDWHFRVYVNQFPSIGWTVETVEYPWQLAMAVDEDLGVTTQKVLRNEIKRLAKVIGYNPKWHGGDVGGLQEIWNEYVSAASGAGGGGSVSIPDGPFYPTCAKAAIAAGFNTNGSPSKATIIVAIAAGESGENLHPDDNHNTNGTRDRGVLQINTVHSDIPDRCARDVACAFQVAYDDLSGRGNNFGPWVVYNEGIYKQYLGKAQAAVAAEIATGGGGRK